MRGLGVNPKREQPEDKNPKNRFFWIFVLRLLALWVSPWTPHVALRKEVSGRKLDGSDLFSTTALFLGVVGLYVQENAKTVLITIQNAASLELVAKKLK